MSIEPQYIDRVLSVFHKVNTLMDNFMEDTKHTELLSNKSKKNDDFGYWYKLKKKYDIWIGLLQYEEPENDEINRKDASGKKESNKNPNTSLFIWFKEDDKIRIKKDAPDYYYHETNQKGKEEYYIPIKTENNMPPDFLYANTLDEQQKKFNELMDHNLTELLKYIKKA